MYDVNSSNTNYSENNLLENDVDLLFGRAKTERSCDANANEKILDLSQTDHKESVLYTSKLNGYSFVTIIIENKEYLKRFGISISAILCIVMFLVLITDDNCKGNFDEKRKIKENTFIFYHSFIVFSN